VPFTVEEKVRIRYHLGYMSGGTTAASLSLGIPRPAQTAFLVESAMGLVHTDAEDRVRQILQTMDSIECRLGAVPGHLAVASVDGLTLREQEGELLEREYVRWGMRLADIIGCPIYPFSERYKRYVGGGVNIPVRG
jgi:hypothetical protein